MSEKKIELGSAPVGRLFRQYFVPTLFAMISMCVVTMADGVFVGQGVGSDAVAAVNIVFAPMMMMYGVGLMLGIGCSVTASIQLSHGAVDKARRTVTYAMLAGTAIVTAYVIVMLADPEATGCLLGSSPTLLKPVVDYLVFFTPGLILNVWGMIGLFVIRLDGSPRFAMWCSVIPGLLNIILDYLFIFPFGWGLRGAAAATGISVSIGGIMAMVYLLRHAAHLKLIRIPFTLSSMGVLVRSVLYQMRIGISAFLGESTMAVLMYVGNIVFMRHLGDNGVAAFGVACYYCPFFFMMGNAIAQSAQPIISYNYGLGAMSRVRSTERIAIITALTAGIIVTAGFILFPVQMVGLFIGNESEAARIAIDGMPIFACCIIFFIFNLTAIGYFQSVESVAPSVGFALLRGLVFLVPAFLLLPGIMGVPGIWMALGVSEMLTGATIILYYIFGRWRQNG